MIKKMKSTGKYITRVFMNKKKEYFRLLIDDFWLVAQPVKYKWKEDKI